MESLPKSKGRKVIKISKFISVIFVLLLSILLTYASFSGGLSEAYLFPKLISSFMMILSSIALMLYFYNKTEIPAEINVKKLSIYLITLISFIFFGELVSFYFLSILLFVTISFFYSWKKTRKTLFYNLLIAIIFMLFIYFLFTILLKVQVPRSSIY